MSVDVLLIFRKKNPAFFSIETVFKRIIVASSAGVKFRRLTLPEYGISIKNLLYLFRQKKVHKEIFHVTGDVHYCVFVLPRKRTILTIHDCVFLEQNKGIKKWILKIILLDIPVRMVDHITTISEKTKKEIIRFTGCDPEKISVIHNPILPAIYHANRTFNNSLPTFLFIGITVNKNLERVAEALVNIKCRLSIVGRLSPMQEITLKKFKIDYQSEYGLSDEEMADKYANSDVILFPSLYEGFGLPIIEGFKAGRVVVTSDRSPMKDVAQGAACLVDPENIGSIRAGILKVTEDKAYRDELIYKGLEVVKQFEPEEIAQKYVHLYEKVYKESCAG